MVRVLVESPDPGIATYLRQELPAGKFEVASVPEGTPLSTEWREAWADIVVIVEACARTDEVFPALLALLDSQPEARAIFMDSSPCTPVWLPLIRLGFAHLDGSRMTRPPRVALVEAVRAAAMSCVADRRSAGARTGELARRAA